MCQRQAAIITLALVLPLPACSEEASSPSPDATRLQEAPPVSPLEQPSEELGIVILEDDFSDPNSGWPEGTPPDPQAQGAEVGYEDGGFLMEAPQGAKIAHLLPFPGRESANHVILEVEAIHTGEHAIYGLFCKGDQRLANAYLFTLDSTGTWAVARLSDGTGLEVLGRGTDPAIEPGAAINHFRADCFDRRPLPNPVAELRLFINDVLLFEGQDRPGLSGRAQSVPGFYFETDFEGGASVLFDNLVFWGVRDPSDVPVARVVSS
ncbi:MAG TPA: hypothetical protein VG602_10595 [Actinomycetota bacterium]|nr:hypothetical protein [Actinomycetota bacterium]